jgi:hypothetical protein
MDLNVRERKARGLRTAFTPFLDCRTASDDGHVPEHENAILREVICPRGIVLRRHVTSDLIKPMTNCRDIWFGQLSGAGRAAERQCQAEHAKSIDPLHRNLLRVDVQSLIL